MLERRRLTTLLIIARAGLFATIGQLAPLGNVKPSFAKTWKGKMDGLPFPVPCASENCVPVLAPQVNGDTLRSCLKIIPCTARLIRRSTSSQNSVPFKDLMKLLP